MSRKSILKLPNLFIGSSSEALKVAIKVARNLKKHTNPVLWNDNVFILTKTSIENLFSQLENSDFGIFIFNPDDVIRIKGKRYQITRDNVIFELGLFMGKLGRERCIMMLPQKQINLRIPTDLLGIVYSTYDHKRQSIPRKETVKIKKLIQELGKVKI